MTDNHIPSSPPLPPLPSISLCDPLSPTSSEPPLFSSDDPLDAEEATNYISPRVKRKRAGPWWEAEPSETIHIPKKSKAARNLSRNFDSGVWLLSDESEEMEEEQSYTERKTEDTDPDEKNLVVLLAEVINRNGLVFACDRLQLRDKHLYHLSQLNQVVQPAPNPDIQVPSERQFRTMVPQLVLNLSYNLLRFPGYAVFQIENLVHLDLRENQIEELPPTIRGLRNLNTLNLSNNKLQWLPFEMFYILSPRGKLKNLRLHGNPLLGLNDGFALNAAPDPDESLYVCKTLESYYDDFGRLMKGSPSIPVPGESNRFFKSIYLRESGLEEPYVPECSKAPSLLSLTLKQSLQLLKVPEVENMLKPVPPTVQYLLNQARTNEERTSHALRPCSVCDGSFITPKVEWLELWMVFPRNMFPVKYQCCSLRCVPQQREKKSGSPI